MKTVKKDKRGIYLSPDVEVVSWELTEALCTGYSALQESSHDDYITTDFNWNSWN